MVRTDAAHDTFNADHFSATDRAGITVIEAGQPGYQGYLGTPGGGFLQYDPATGKETPL